MAGQIADFRIYASTLTSEDVKDLYQSSALITKQGDCVTKTANEGEEGAFKRGQIVSKSLHEGAMGLY
jgi:hypothetical protein